MNKLTLSAIIASTFILSACERPKSADSIQAAQQEVILQEGTSQVGMPAIKNFRERRLLKLIYEIRDQEGLATFTYLVSSTGELKFLCNSFGYAISDATGFTNPDKLIRDNGTAFGTMPQAEPNGLFTPNFSNTSWVLCSDGKGKTAPVQIPSNAVVSTIALK